MGIFQDLLTSLALILNSSEIWNIAALSLFISVSAVILSTLVGIPIGVYFGMKGSDNRLLTISFLNTGMGLPPVLVGLVVYLFLTRQGPLGVLGLLFTPLAMIIAQFILTLPIIIGITRSTIIDMPNQLPEMLRSLGGTPRQVFWEIICEARSGMVIAIIVALGRAFSEVGAIIIVGGNIRYHTRVLTTAIITEIGMGQRATALALGILLMSISFGLTTIMTIIQFRSNN